MLSSIEIQSFTFIVGFQEVQSENWKLKLSQIPKIFTIHNWTLIFRVNCTEFITSDKLYTLIFCLRRSFIQELAG